MRLRRAAGISALTKPPPGFVCDGPLLFAWRLLHLHLEDDFAFGCLHLVSGDGYYCSYGGARCRLSQFLLAMSWPYGTGVAPDVMTLMRACWNRDFQYVCVLQEQHSAGAVR